MDPIVLAFGPALVGAIATDAWPRVREAVTGLWRRGHPRRRPATPGPSWTNCGSRSCWRAATATQTPRGRWRGPGRFRLQQLLRADPTLAAELRRVLDQVLTPALTPAEQARVGTIIMTGSSHDSSTFTQIGTQTNYNRP